MRDDTLILCYHAVSESWPSELAVRPERLREQVAYLLDRGYRPANFTDAVQGSAGERVFVVTFDDALRSVFDLGRPVLADLGVPATLFVPTDFPGSGVPFPLPGAAWVGGEHESELECMGWDEVRQLRDEGWEIGSHTCSHPWLTQTSTELLSYELTRSAEVLAGEMGERCRSIAYPYGDHDDRVVAATEAAGYETACTVPHRFEDFRSTSLEYGRIDVTRSEPPWAFRARVSAISRRARSARPTRALHWLDTHRLHRRTVVAAARSQRRRATIAKALRAHCQNWAAVFGEQARGAGTGRLLFRDGVDFRFASRQPANLERFGEAFVDRPWTHGAPLEADGTVVDLGAGEGLFALAARADGCARVVCVEDDPLLADALRGNLERNRLETIAIAEIDDGEDPLGQLLAAAGVDRVGFLRIAKPGGSEMVLAASAATLASISRLALHQDPDHSGPRIDEVATRMQENGFDVQLDLDDVSRGYVTARRTRAPDEAPAPGA